MNTTKALAAAATLWALTGAAQAALFDRGGGMIYDDVSNITWLKNWNVNGRMTFTEADTWANTLDYGGGTDWRLPTFTEIGEELFDVQYLTQGGMVFMNRFFTNVKTDDSYWSSTPFFDPDQGDNYIVQFGSPVEDGSIGFSGGLRTEPYYAVAVHNGDLGAAVPEPQTLALVLLALGGALAASRKRPA
jgi:hypothetical protein